MAINNEVPIQLTPNMSNRDTTAFTNENFRKLYSGFNPIIVNDGNDNRILIGKRDDDTYGVYVSGEGYDVSVATDDQLVMSSDFNLHKIIASGSCSFGTRAGTVTLTTTNIGYSLTITINPGIADALKILNGPIFLRVYNDGTYENISRSGLFYDDGTNKAFYDVSYRIDEAVIVLNYSVRLVSGSLTFTPNDFFMSSIRWEICNNTQTTSGGHGGGGPGSGKYVFCDSRSFDKNGVQTVGLVSATNELTSATWAYFPLLVDYV